MFQISHQTILILSWSYSQTILHTFPDIRQYWHFQRVTGKQYYTLFQSLYQAILTFSESSFQTIVKSFSRIHITQQWHFQRVTAKQYWLIQDSYQTVFTLSNNHKHFFESLNGHLNIQKFSNRKFSTKSEFTWLVIDGFMEENGLAPPPKKDISSPTIQKKYL